jgi:zinc transporter ZupT
MIDTLALVFFVALLSDVATGLGALPLLFLRSDNFRWRGIAEAVAAGMMLSASVFALADKALRRGNALEVIGGMLAGAVFFAASARVVERRHWRIGGWTEDNSRQSILLILTMFVHSIPEGVAIGVGYATGEMRFGLLLAIAIAVHNIPEGTAVSLPLHTNGASTATCFWYSVLTSLPQPLVAVPAFLLVSVFQPLLAASLGFAGGAMIFLVISELLPDSFTTCSKTDAAWGVTLGLVAMLGFTAALGL